MEEEVSTVGGINLAMLLGKKPKPLGDSNGVGTLPPSYTILTWAHECSRMLTYAHVCSRMVYGGESGGLRVLLFTCRVE